MAFTDSFTGSNGAALSSTNWETVGSTAAPTIYSNAARGGGDPSCVRIKSCSSNDQYAKGDFLGMDSWQTLGTPVAALTVRNSASQQTCYSAEMTADTDFDSFYDLVITLWRYTNGGWTYLTQGAVPNGSAYGISLTISGHVLTARDSSGTTICTYTDNSGSYISSGTPGVQFFGSSTTYRIDNFESTDLASNDATGTVASTLEAVVSSASGLLVPSGTAAATLEAVVSSASATHAPPGFTGTVDATVEAVTPGASGTYTPPSSTGTVAVTLEAVVSSAAGDAVAPQITGAVDVTLADVVASATGTWAEPGPLYSDNFNGLTNGAELTGYWKSPGGAGTGAKAYNGTGVRMPSPGVGRSVYQNAISSNQYSEIAVTGGNIKYLKLQTRSATSGNNRYEAGFWFDDELGETHCTINKQTPLTTALLDTVVAASGTIRFEATSIGANQPVRLRVYSGGSQIAECWDTANPINNGYPGFSLDRDGVSYVTCDNWAAGEVDPPPTAGVGAFPVAALATSGSVGEPVAGVGAFPGATVAASGSIGEPIAATGEFPGKALAVSGNANATISKAKQSTIYPTFTAFGGTDSYTGLAKGQIARNGDRTIGYRKGLGDDGVAGDRVFFTIAAANLLRADTPTDPVAGATLHVALLSCMSWDYHAGAKPWAAGTYPPYDVVANGGNNYFCLTAGTSVNGPSGTSLDATDGGTAHWRYIGAASSPSPSGVAFRVRKANDPSLGMSATLSGDYGAITAKPTWLSGQTWYDGSTAGNPIEEQIVDITTLYNEASQAGVDLHICLECELSDLKWTAELVGTDSTMAWGRPRVEVQRWGEVAIEIVDQATCCPTITVTPEAQTGTVSRIQWGYDAKLSPPAGVFKYATGELGVVGEGIWTSSPYTMPMLEPCSRVHVEVEVDYGAAGSLVFKRTWKTPQVFAPKLQLLADVYDETTAADPDETAKGLTDLVGPAFGLAAIHGDRWLAFGKKTGGTTLAAATAYARGDRVIHGGYVWWCRVAGTTGNPLTLPTTPANNTPPGGVVDGTATFTADGTGYQTFKLGNTNDGWAMFSIDALESDYKLRRLVGSTDLSPLADYERPWPLPYQSQGMFDPGWGTMYLDPGLAMHLEADDISPLFADLANHAYFFLSSHQTNEGYEVRLNILPGDGDNGSDVLVGDPAGILLKAEYELLTQEVVYVATAAPNLRALSAVTSTSDWRHGLVNDAMPPVLIAFVADGSLRCFKRTFAKQPSTGPLIGNEYTYLATISADFSPVTVSNISSVRFCHLLLRNGDHRTILAAIGSGTSWVGARTDDTFTFLDGGGFTRNSGAWSTFTDTSVARVWTTETNPCTALGNDTAFGVGPHAPDAHSAAVAIQKTDGTVRFYDTLLNLSPGGAPTLQPRADFPGTAFTYNRQTRAVTRWPTLPGQGELGAYATTMNGGMVAFRASGSTLYCQRVRDFLRVGNESSVDVTDTVTEILVGPDNFVEGQAVPVMLNTSGGYRVVLVTVDLDISRMHLPSYDLVHRFQSGALTVDNIQKDSGNQRSPEEFQHLPGHNTFSTGWRFDYKADGTFVTNPYGMMNESGWNYFRLTGCEGERMRFLVYDTPAFGFKWRSGTQRNMTLDGAYQPEFAGGSEWCNLKFSTWFWTNDPPSGLRRWHRIMDGMDYVLDGDSGGGCYVVTIQSPGDDIWIAHDMVADVATWKSEITDLVANDSASYIKWVNASGELLYGVTPTPTAVISQVVVMP